MKIMKMSDIVGTDREVECPRGGFTSFRFLLASDEMGYTITHTFVPIGPPQHWHYKNHLEACYCIRGGGFLTNLATGEKHLIAPGTMYVLDKNDDHTFQATTRAELICVFNPPLTGREVHQEDGAYEVAA